MANLIRVKCTPDMTDQDTWHYWKETQEVLDDTIVCGDHPSGDLVEDFVIEGIEE